MPAQGYRQLRWAAASVFLLLLAVLGGRAAERQERHERSGAATMAMAAAATSATTDTAQLPTPTRMLSMAEIRAHTAASARLKRKAATNAGAAAAGKRDRVGEEPNVHGVKYAAAVQPNAKLLRLGRQRQRVASLPHLATNSPSALIPTSLTGTSATLVTSPLRRIGSLSPHRLVFIIII